MRVIRQHRSEGTQGVDEVIEIFRGRPEWAGIIAKLASKLRSAGVPEESIEEVSDIAVRRSLEGARNGLDNEVVRWTLAWDILTSYIFKNLSTRKRKRFRLYSERVGTLGLTRREQQIAFYIVWGLGNKEIAARIGRGENTVKNEVKILRRKLGIRAVGLDDRVNTVLTILGL